MTRLRAALTALALAVTVLLVGCSQAAPTTTAVVNGVVIHESDIDSTTAAYLAAVGGDYRLTRAQVVVTYLRGELARQIAAEKGLTLVSRTTDARIQKYPDLVAYTSADDDWNDLKAALSTEDFAAVLAAQDVLLNPRYGDWKTNVTSGSLSEAAPSK